MPYVKGKTVTSQNLKDQLLHLKIVSERLGVLHEAQILQIRNYPLLIPNIKKAETSIDIDTKTIKYECKSKTGRFRKAKQAKDMMDSIYQWIKTIAWDATVLEIRVDGKDVYDSRQTTTSH